MKYPLEIENTGTDVYIIMSRGHHDIHEFMRKVREDYNWPLGVPTHLWLKTTPTKDPSYTCMYSVVKEGTRGAWPATHTQEAWGEDAYEAKFPEHAAKAKP